jgi:uncharacterized membrane protein YedE/YeeE
MRHTLAALAAGLLFSLGLTVSQMANAAKVLRFLDLAGDWDPSLALRPRRRRRHGGARVSGSYSAPDGRHSARRRQAASNARDDA